MLAQVFLVPISLWRTIMCDLVHESLPQGQHLRALRLTRCAHACIETDYRCILVCSRQNDQFITYVAAASANRAWLLPYRPRRPIRASDSSIVVETSQR